MRKTIISFSAACLAVWSSCSITHHSGPLPDNHDYLLMSLAWYRQSAEMQALYFQAFNVARWRFDQSLADTAYHKPLAVVVDIDETMLDNSPFEAGIIAHGEDRDAWAKWSRQAVAKALPGAVGFAQYVQQHQAEIFYITNRDDQERAATLQNLQNEGFPFADEAHLLTRSDTAFYNGNTSSKMGRRARVAATHHIVLLLGDNLNDFSEVFEDRKTNNGKDQVALNRDQFGDRYIVMPNPMYGAWEKPVFDYRPQLSGKQKTELLRAKVK